MDKFEEICEEFGGDFQKEDRWISTINVCEFKDDLDDMKAFSQWMKHQKKIPREQRAKWDYAEGGDMTEIVFVASPNRTFALSVEKERSLGSGESMAEFIEDAAGKLSEKKLEKLSNKLDWSDIYIDTAVEKLIDESKVKPYLRNDADISIGYNSDYDYHYVKGEVNSTIFGSLQPHIDDALDAVDDITARAEMRFYDIFREKVREERKRL